MQLYSGSLSLFTAKVRIALDEKGVPYERIEVGWSLERRYEPHHPEVVRLNPKRQVPVLVDTTWRGTPAKLLMAANRNGFFYVLDRVTGKFLLGKPFIDAFPWAVLNVHPSLLPAFPGIHAQRQALDHGVKVTGATVHFVNAELDAGPVILQAPVPVLDDDTEDTLSARILVQEHRLYPLAIARVLSGKLRIEGRRVVLGE